MSCYLKAHFNKFRILPLFCCRSVMSVRSLSSSLAAGRTNVCVVGGGFGGLYSALRIDSRAGPSTDVYLLDPKDSFVFLPLLYELSVGNAVGTEVTPRYADILRGTRIKHIQARVNSLDITGRTCQFQNMHGEEGSLPFDAIVLAVGIQPRIDFIPGAKEHTIPFYSAQQADALAQKLQLLQQKTDNEVVNVAVLGAGDSGVEVATNIADMLGKEKANISIVDRNSDVMHASDIFNRRTAARVLKAKGITTRLKTNVLRVNENSVELEDSAVGQYTLPADVVVLTAGTEQLPFIRTLPLRKDAYGRILTRRTLQCVDEPSVFALGDCAVVEGDGSSGPNASSYPATAQVAMQQSYTAADNVLTYLAALQGAQGGALPQEAASARVTAKDEEGNVARSAPSTPKLKEFRFFNLGQMASLGTTEATISSLGGWVALSGPIAALGRRVVYGVRMPTVRQTVVALLSAAAVMAGKLLDRVKRWFGR